MQSFKQNKSVNFQKNQFFSDFAYVARDRNSRRFLCHVFRCDTPARAIANTLRDICKRLMLQRQAPQAYTPTTERSERRIVRKL